MEILQTIWNVLTSESERIANLCICPFSFLESYLYMRVFLTLLNIDSTKKQRLIYTFSFALIAVINIIFVPYPYYTFVNVIACPILAIIIFKISIIYGILCEISMYIVSILVATPLLIIYTTATKITSSMITSIPLHRLIYSWIFYLLVYLFYKACVKFKINILRLGKIKNKFSIPIVINFLVGTFAIAVQGYLEFIYIDYIPVYLVLLSISILIIYFFISMFILFRTSKLEITAEKLEEEKLYNQTLGLLYDNIRGFKHDFNNIVQGIGGYISTDNMDGLKEYYSEILEDCQKVNNLSLLSPEVINNPAIYSLLTSKYFVATESGIKFNLEVFMDLSSIDMKIYELTRILGILLDNAIEASKQCDEKIINITIRKDNKKNKQLFIIENTYLNKDVNIDEIFEKGKTSKTTEDAKNHGLGLWEVRTLIKKRKNLDLYTTKDEKYFRQQFEIYCSRN